MIPSPQLPKHGPSSAIINTEGEGRFFPIEQSWISSRRPFLRSIWCRVIAQREGLAAYRVSPTARFRPGRLGKSRFWTRSRCPATHSLLRGESQHPVSLVFNGRVFPKVSQAHLTQLQQADCLPSLHNRREWKPTATTTHINAGGTASAPPSEPNNSQPTRTRFPVRS